MLMLKAYVLIKCPENKLKEYDTIKLKVNTLLALCSQYIDRPKVQSSPISVFNSSSDFDAWGEL